MREFNFTSLHICAFGAKLPVHELAKYVFNFTINKLRTYWGPGLYNEGMIDSAFLHIPVRGKWYSLIDQINDADSERQP